MSAGVDERQPEPPVINAYNSSSANYIRSLKFILGLSFKRINGLRWDLNQVHSLLTTCTLYFIC